MKIKGFELPTLDGGTVALSSSQLEQLTASLEGELLGPGDDGWEEAIALGDGKQPALIVRPASAEDVARTLRFAREHRLRLTVTGNDIAAPPVTVGALTLDMSRVGDVAVDPEG